MRQPACYLCYIFVTMEQSDILQGLASAQQEAHKHLEECARLTQLLLHGATALTPMKSVMGNLSVRNGQMSFNRRRQL